MRRVSATGILSCSRFLTSFEALDQVYKFFCQIREFFVSFGNDADFSSRKRGREIELLNFSFFLDGIDKNGFRNPPDTETCLYKLDYQIQIVTLNVGG